MYILHFQFLLRKSWNSFCTRHYSNKECRILFDNCNFIFTFLVKIHSKRFISMVIVKFILNVFVCLSFGLFQFSDLFNTFLRRSIIMCVCVQYLYLSGLLNLLVFVYIFRMEFRFRSLYSKSLIFLFIENKQIAFPVHRMEIIDLYEHSRLHVPHSFLLCSFIVSWKYLIFSFSFLLEIELKFPNTDNGAGHGHEHMSIEHPKNNVWIFDHWISCIKESTT